MVILLASSGCRTPKSDPPPNQVANPVPPVTPVAPVTPVVPDKPILISSDELIAAAAKDKAATDKKYHGRILIVGGMVDVDYARSNPDGRIARLVDYGQTGAVLCTMKPVVNNTSNDPSTPEPTETPSPVAKDNAGIVVQVFRCRYDGVLTGRPGETEIELSDCEPYYGSDRNRVFDNQPPINPRTRPGPRRPQ